MKILALVTTLGLSMDCFAAGVAEANFQLRERDDQMVYSDIKPILDVHCVRCHSGNKPRANLKLSSFPFAKNGSTDSALQQGIVTRMIARAQNEEKPMPPRQSPFQRLDSDQLESLQQWLDDGLLTQPESLFVIQTLILDEDGQVEREEEFVFEKNPFLGQETIQLEL